LAHSLNHGFRNVTGVCGTEEEGAESVVHFAPSGFGTAYDGLTLYDHST
jgi:hypothetical protein